MIDVLVARFRLLLHDALLVAERGPLGLHIKYGNYILYYLILFLLLLPFTTACAIPRAVYFVPELASEVFYDLGPIITLKTSDGSVPSCSLIGEIPERSSALANPAYGLPLRSLENDMASDISLGRKALVKSQTPLDALKPVERIGGIGMLSANTGIGVVATHVALSKATFSWTAKPSAFGSVRRYKICTVAFGCAARASRNVSMFRTSGVIRSSNAIIFDCCELLNSFVKYEQCDSEYRADYDAPKNEY